MSDVKQSWKAIQIPFEQISALSDERKCYDLSEREIAMLLSQAGYFYWSSRWSKASGLTSGDKLLISQWAATLEAHLLGTDACDNVCLDYPMSASIIDIEPANPYTEPGYIPDGYVVPPWTIVTAPIFGTTLQPGDIVANGPTASTEFPHIRVNFTGEAEIELHYVTIPFGGMLQTQKDGDILTLGYTDLNADIVSVPPEANTEDTTLEFKFEGTGDHFLDVTFLPRINDELELLGYGGALRKLVICGLNLECPDMPFDVRQNEDDPCELDKSTDDGETWEAWANLRLCAPVLVNIGGIVGVQLPDGTIVGTTTGDPTYDGREHAPPPAEREGSSTDNKCIASANAVNTLLALHATVARLISVPDALTIAAALAGLLISLLFIPIAIGIIVTIIAGGAMVIFASLTYGDFDSDVQHELQCILDCNASDTGGVVTFSFSAVKAAVGDNIAPLNIWAAIDKYLDIIGESGLNLAGATTAITEADCTDCGCGGCYEWDQSQLESIFTFDFGANGSLSSYCHLAAGGHYTQISVWWSYNGLGGGSGGSGNGIGIYDTTNYSHNLQFSSPLSATPSPYVWNGDQDFPPGLAVGGNADGALDGGAGRVTITQIRVRYTGDKPAGFTGGSDC